MSLIYNKFTRQARIFVLVFVFMALYSACSLLQCAEDIDAKSSKFGINKNQPIAVGDYFYRTRNNSGNVICTYFYEGIENNAIKIKIESCFNSSPDLMKPLSPEELIKEIKIHVLKSILSRRFY